MAQITKWLRERATSFVDPGREERIGALVAHLRHDLNAQGGSFSLARSLSGLQFTEADLAEAKARVYRRAIAKAWQDERLTAGEARVAEWIVKGLEIEKATATRITLEAARECFGRVLAHAMKDGRVDAREVDHLQYIAGTIDCALADLARGFFHEECEGFLRGMFLGLVADGRLSEAEWDALLLATQQLGISQQEMLRAIQPQARQFVEHVLADAKADGRLSDREEATLSWLLGRLNLPAAFHSYVNREIKNLQLRTQITEGHLPTLRPAAGVQVKAGELVHYQGPAIWRQVRYLKSGPRVNEHEGCLVLTDHRLIFSSQIKPQRFNYSKIITHRGGPHGIEIQVDNKPALTFFPEDESGIPYLVFSTALAMSHQRKVAKSTGGPTRHIPRDVRQRVWQRYGGRCAECGADDYLEYDHIIPHSRGGSNSDNNIQLLCRRCNLKKSDSI